MTTEDRPFILGRNQGKGRAGLGGTGRMPARASEEEKRSQTEHKTLYLSYVLLSSAYISSILMMSFIVETQRDNGGVVVVLQKRRMSCQATDRKKRKRHNFWETIDPGNMERRAISGG